MGKIRRGNYVFMTWKGDHPPRHVHVLRDGRLIVKWDLEKGQSIKGDATPLIVRLIEELQQQGKL